MRLLAPLLSLRLRAGVFRDLHHEMVQVAQQEGPVALGERLRRVLGPLERHVPHLPRQRLLLRRPARVASELDAGQLTVLCKGGAHVVLRSGERNETDEEALRGRGDERRVVVGVRRDDRGAVGARLPVRGVECRLGGFVALKVHVAEAPGLAGLGVAKHAARNEPTELREQIMQFSEFSVLVQLRHEERFAGRRCAPGTEHRGGDGVTRGVLCRGAGTGGGRRRRAGGPGPAVGRTGRTAAGTCGALRGVRRARAGGCRHGRPRGGGGSPGRCPRQQSLRLTLGANL
mmetsp:Transcript_11760/g.36540  ORF Transcript_11760/g.36540 Transcript_11760/m.36540 type:complete len:288 (+) Transcript_11760:871-1734(+)